MEAVNPPVAGKFSSNRIGCADRDWRLVSSSRWGLVWLGILGFLLGLDIFQVAGAQSVTLAWNANTETNLAGYRLYYGPAPRNYSGHVQVVAPVTAGTVTNLVSGRTYYFAVTAYTRD